MRLTKRGILREAGAPVDDDTPNRPRDVATFLRCWHDLLEAIDDDYTFGDLVSLLRDVEDLGELSPLLDCDVAAFLADADRPVDNREADQLEYLKVCNFVELTKYVPDPTQPDEHLEWLDEAEAVEDDLIADGVAALTGEKPPRMLVDATGDDPITGKPILRRMKGPRIHGTWIPPYHLTREFVGWGKWKEQYVGCFAEHPEIDPEKYEGAYAVDFSPLAELLHLPLRYDPKVQFWSGKSSGDGELLLETQLTITLGEFLRAIFFEIGFFGSPSERDDALEDLTERAAAIERDDAKPS